MPTFKVDEMTYYKNKTWCINDKCYKRKKCKLYAGSKVCFDVQRSGQILSKIVYKCEFAKRSKIKVKKESEQCQNK